MTNQEELWKQFRLKNNLSSGAGILYCLRYETSRLEAHHSSVVGALKDLGASILEDKNKLGIKFSSENIPNCQNRICALVEELDCLNEALEYSYNGFGDCRNIEDLKNKLLSVYLSMITDGDCVNAYNLVDLEIPNLVRDLKHAHKSNKVLSSRDRKSLSELENFAERQAHHLNDPRGYIIFG